MRPHPLVSVVTPVYNGEAFLRSCIESVLAQTYTHWDYTIVNNRSTDRTLEIAREYAAKDTRIRVHENEAHVRVIENHNVAFRQISPESAYCKVIAADDRMLPDCLESMVALAEAHPSVAIVGAYGLLGRRVIWTGLEDRGPVIGGREVCRLRLLGGPYVFGTPTSVLYRSSIVRSRPAFYNESNLHGDEEVCLEFLQQHDFGFIHRVLTVQGERQDSLTSYSSRYQTYMPWRLDKLVRYGPIYLSREEMERQLEVQIARYYRYLGGQVYHRRGRSFWDLHRRKLAEVGFPLRMPRLAWEAMAYGADRLINVKKLAQTLRRQTGRPTEQA